MKLSQIRHAKWFDTAYKIGVGIKGLDGLAELVAGIILIFSPHAPHRILHNVAAEFNERPQNIFHFFAHQVVHLDAQLTGHVLIFIIIFLITHGIVKLALVYALFRKILWMYPYALAALLILFGIQVAPLFRQPGDLALWLFTILDALIVYLVWGEYQDIKEAQASKSRKIW